MNKKLLFFDIDGTILTEGDERYIPESAVRAIQLLQENGHSCFINSGRTWSEIHTDISGMGFDGFVCGCGTNIRYHGNVLLEREIPMEMADGILDDFSRCRLEWLLEGQHTVYYSTEPYTSRISKLQREFHEQFPGICSDIDPAARGLHYDKFCICACPGSDLDSFIGKYAQHFSFIDRGNQFYEVVPAGCSKASGMQFLMDYFNIPLEDTIAIGDSTNDLPMLDFAGLSIGMKASDPPVLETVDYITDTVENDGIYKALQHFGLL